MPAAPPYLTFAADLASDAVVNAYDELPLWSAAFGALLLEHVPLAGIRTALDVGCGTGFPLIELAERLGPAAEVHGVDPWQAGLVRAKSKLAVRGVENVRLHDGSAAALPFDDATFDLIVSNLGINNFDDAPSVVRECRRVARPGATIALTTNLQGHMQEFYAVFEEVLRATGDRESIRRLREHIAHRATVSSACDLLETGGFTVKRVVERSSHMRFADGTALFNHYFIKLGFLDGWKGTVPGTEATVFPALEARLNERAQQAGELSLTIPMAYIEGFVG
ncbi:MAG TPA: class I SAM-dependent methyltransferase [Thermoanaerobaculia bacterium]|jgi:ubiquinone/menaquinone biosynthesis C-methylase UbiE